MELRAAVSSPPLVLSTLTTAEDLKRIAGEWADLVERTGNVLPFVLPDWLAAWWETFRQDDPLIKDSLRVKTVRRSSGELVGIFPFMLTERPSFGPVRVRTLHFLGADDYITEQRAPVVSPECEEEVARAVAAHLLDDEAWHWIRWDGLRSASVFGITLQRMMGLQWGRAEPGNILRLAPSWEQFKAGLKRNIKESLRRCYNSLKRAGLTFRLVVSERGDDVERALDTFFALHATRARKVDGVIHPDRFRGERAKQFLRTVCARLAERGVTRVFTLYVDGTAVASRIGFLLPGCLYLYYSGFDPAWGKYSVMTTTVAEAIKYAIDRRVPRVHLSMGADVSKARWGPETPQLHQAICVRRRAWSEAAMKLHLWASAHPDNLTRLCALLPRRQFN